MIEEFGLPTLHGAADIPIGDDAGNSVVRIEGHTKTELATRHLDDSLAEVHLLRDDRQIIGAHDILCSCEQSFAELTTRMELREVARLGSHAPASRPLPRRHPWRGLRWWNLSERGSTGKPHGLRRPSRTVEYLASSDSGLRLMPMMGTCMWRRIGMKRRSSSVCPELLIANTTSSEVMAPRSPW